MKKISFFFLLTTTIIIIVYSSLVVVDIIIPRISKFNETYKSAQKEFIRSNIEFINFNVLQNKKKIRKIIKESNLVPTGTIPYTSKILCNEGYGTIKFNSDRFGFRNEDDIWKKFSEIDAILIGDSFGSGICVDEEHTISSFLIKKKIITLNLSIPGNSPLNYKLLNKIFTEAISPKHVIILFYQNDNTIIDNYHFFSDYEKVISSHNYLYKNKNEIKPSIELINLHKNLEDKINKNLKITYLEKFDEFFFKMKKYLFLANTRKYFNFLLGNKKLIGHNKSLIDDVIKICKKVECDPIFALIRASNYWDPQYFYADYKKSLNKYLVSKGYALLTFDEIIDFKKPLFYAPNGGHLSKLGYKLISQKIFNSLSN